MYKAADTDMNIYNNNVTDNILSVTGGEKHEAQEVQQGWGRMLHPLGLYGQLGSGNQSLDVRCVLRVFGLYHTKEPDHCVIVLCMCVYVNKL